MCIWGRIAERWMTDMKEYQIYKYWTFGKTVENIISVWQMKPLASQIQQNVILETKIIIPCVSKTCMNFLTEYPSINCIWNSVHQAFSQLFGSYNILQIGRTGICILCYVMLCYAILFHFILFYPILLHPILSRPIHPIPPHPFTS